MLCSPVRLLCGEDPRPVAVFQQKGRSPFFLTCEHAGRAIPRGLANLGVSEHERARHIGWDIGAAATAKLVSRRLGAPLILQTYSRLVIDCNRHLDHPDSIPLMSEHTEIPGNRNLSTPDRAARANEIYRPYHQAIFHCLEARRRAQLPSILVAMHSFTPVFKGKRRPWHIGLLFNRDPRLAKTLALFIEEDQAICLGINEPYAISDAIDFTIPVHGEKRGILHIEIEIRQDLIETSEGQSAWAERLANWLFRCQQNQSIMSWM